MNKRRLKAVTLLGIDRLNLPHLLQIRFSCNISIELIKLIKKLCQKRHQLL